MYNTLTRLQNVTGTFTTAVSIVALVIAVVSLVTTPNPSINDGTLALKNVQVVKGRPHYYSRAAEEYAHITFDLSADLTDLFTWNTKQVFLYITTTYPPNPFVKSTRTTADPPATTAVLWDAILQHPLAPAHINHFDPANPSGKRSKRRGGSQDKTADADAAAQKQKTVADVAIIRLEGQKPKYQITDPTGRIAGRANATLELNWNVQPWVGALTWGAGGLAESGGRPRAHTPASWFGFGAPWHTWRAVQGRGQTALFDLPRLKNQTEASRAAGKQGLGTAKGREGHRLEVG